MVDEYSHMVWIENMKSGQELCPVKNCCTWLRQKGEMESGARFDVFEVTVRFQQRPGRNCEAKTYQTGKHNTSRTQEVGETVIGHISRLTRSIMAGCDPDTGPGQSITLRLFGIIPSGEIEMYSHPDFNNLLNQRRPSTHR